jgi:predicted nucleic acid-binding protein
MIVVDANVFVSLLVPADAHHERCVGWLRAQLAAGESLVAPVLLLPEVGGAISRRASAVSGREALAALRRIRTLRLVPIDAKLADLSATLAVAHGLRGADAVYAAVADALHVSLVTLDADFQRIAGRVKVIAP